MTLRQLRFMQSVHGSFAVLALIIALFAVARFWRWDIGTFSLVASLIFTLYAMWFELRADRVELEERMRQELTRRAPR